MIAKKHHKKIDKKDSYADLGQYIAAAKEDGEKLCDLWIVNCNAGDGIDDLDLAIMEIEATQALNQGAYYSKAYHLTVNFAPGEKPEIDTLKAIEQEFSKALGFEEHQRICGTHQNTDHFHMHIAYNRIHPESFKAHQPFNDYLALEKTCRDMEQKYGLIVTKGMSDYREYDKASGKPQTLREGLSNAALDYEAATWEESFQRHLQNHAGEIIEASKKATNWQAFHALAADYGAGVKLRGNGMVFYNLRSRGKAETMKLSAIRSNDGKDFLSKAKLEKQLGTFEPPIREWIQRINQQDKQATKPYLQKPLTKHPKQKRLWQKYLGMTRGQLKKQSLSGRAFNNWKEFLYADALNDPMAMAIIYYQRKMVETLLGNNPNFYNKSKSIIPPMPNSLEPILTHWKGKERWMQGEDIHSILNQSTKGKYGISHDKDGNVILPYEDIKGNLWGLKVIAAGGKQINIGDHKRSGLVHVIGNRLNTDKQQIIVCKDYALASAIHEKTDQTIIIPSNRDEFVELTKKLRTTYKNTSILVVDQSLTTQARQQLSRQRNIEIKPVKDIIPSKSKANQDELGLEL